MTFLTNLLEYIQALFRVVGGVLRLNPEIFSKAYAYPGSLHGLVFWIVLIAGISTMLGQSVVLFANRVPKVRFWISIFLGGVVFVVDALAVATVLWAIANLFGSQSWPYTATIRAVALAYAPYWLAFLILIPYMGLIIERLLDIYVFLAFVVACQAIFGISFWGGLFGAFLALVIKEVLELLAGRLLTPLTDRVERAVTGVDERTSTHEIYEMFARKSRAFTNGVGKKR
jgi:hypothetical protein